MTALTNHLFFTTSTVVDWVDIFTRPTYKHIVIESLAYCQERKGLCIHAWVLMSNHLHLVVSVNDGVELGYILRDFKKFTNKKIMQVLENDIHESRRNWMQDRFCFAALNDRRIHNYRFWQEGNHIEQLYTEHFIRQKIDYIHNNPVRAEIVAHPEDYLYSSAPSYAGDKGLLNIDLLKLM
ncbi:MAG: transposase [Prevotella sp.]|nr:transposase [Prevotella sp.]